MSQFGNRPGGIAGCGALPDLEDYSRFNQFERAVLKAVNRIRTRLDANAQEIDELHDLQRDLDEKLRAVSRRFR
jgi:hypothetical protein